MSVDWMEPENDEQRARFIRGRLEQAERLRDDALAHRAAAYRCEMEARRFEAAARSIGWDGNPLEDSAGWLR